MYRLKVTDHFDSAHFLRSYQGKCANIHGHRWLVEVTVAGAKLNAQGMLVDFFEIKRAMNEILDRYDHKLLNDEDGFREGQLNPTAENIAYYLFQHLKPMFQSLEGDIQLEKVYVMESTNAGCEYSE